MILLLQMGPDKNKRYWKWPTAFKITNLVLQKFAAKTLITQSSVLSFETYSFESFAGKGSKVRLVIG